MTPSLVELIEDKVETDGDALLSLAKKRSRQFLEEKFALEGLSGVLTHLQVKRSLEVNLVSSQGENKEIDIHNIPSLKVSVAVTTVTLPVEEYEFLQYGGFEVLAVPTQGRLSGFDPVHDRL